MLANQLAVAGVDHVMTIDLHASQMQGFFQCPVDNLVAEPILARWIKRNIENWRDAVVVSKNAGGTKRVVSLADALKLNFGIVMTDARRRRFPGGGSLADSSIFERLGESALDPQINDLDVESLTLVERQATNITAPEPRRTTEQSDHARPVNGRPQMWARDNSNASPPLTAIPPSTERRMASNNAIRNGSALNGNRQSTTNHGPTSDSSSPSVSAARLSRVQTLTNTSHPSSNANEEEYTDEPARDVTTGRLVHGHIVEDNYPSPSFSARSGYSQGNRNRGSSDDDESVNGHMMNSFMSATSSKANLDHALGGSGDAADSDEGEEENLKDPEIETTVTLVGNVKDKSVFIVDDMIDKSTSWIAAAETVVKRGGATKVYCMATHGLFGGNCLAEFEECDCIEQVIVTNTFPISDEKRRQTSKLATLDVSNLLAEAIRRNHHGESTSRLFQHFDD
ncbi:MAG: hypothetical protein M1820_008944 [Bogoriella megaspora]|nr:MAG: hypothetical protein M1820_008944 [Bogoriella megaspora]